MQTLATIDENNEGEESNNEVSLSDWETEKIRAAGRLPEIDSTGMSGSNKENTALT